MKARRALRKIPTPVPGLPFVTLYQDTWADHIIKQHVYMAGKETLVETTVTNPTVVVPGTSNPDYVVFVNHQETSSQGSPLTVIIDPRDQVICTALYNKTFRVISPDQEVVWLPPDKK